MLNAPGQSNAGGNVALPFSARCLAIFGALSRRPSALRILTQVGSQHFVVVGSPEPSRRWLLAATTPAA
jgi:hypothetical protein